MTTPAVTGAPGTAGRSPVDLSDIGDPTKMPDHDVSFSDVLTALNPLQYIPIVGSIYRAVTGDAAPAAAQVVVGALVGGPIGLVASAANAIFEQSTGESVGDKVVAWLMPDAHGPAKPSAAPQYATANLPQAAAAVPVPPETAVPPPAAATAPATSGTTIQADSGDRPGSDTVRPQPAPASPAIVAPPTAAPAALSPTPMARGAVPGAAKASGSGWTLADYRGFAGHALPPPTDTKGAVLQNRPVPLQTTIPLPSTSAQAPVVPAVTASSSVAAPAATAGAAPQPQDTWVSEAMMRGLDRYREMMRQQEQQQP